MDWEDRSTCVIFGDGAGAVVLGEGDNYLTSKLYSRGGDDVIKIPQFIGKSPFYEREPMKPYIHMKGQETFKFAVNAMCADVRDVMAEAGMTGEDVAWVVPHQANVRIIHMARQKACIPDERFFINIDRYGNMSAAWHPAALDELNRGRAAAPGGTIWCSAASAAGCPARRACCGGSRQAVSCFLSSKGPFPFCYIQIKIIGGTRIWYSKKSRKCWPII